MNKLNVKRIVDLKIKLSRKRSHLLCLTCVKRSYRLRVARLHLKGMSFPIANFSFVSINGYSDEHINKSYYLFII